MVQAPGMEASREGPDSDKNSYSFRRALSTCVYLECASIFVQEKVNLDQAATENCSFLLSISNKAELNVSF